MKRSVRFIRPLAAVLVTALLFTACVKSDNNDYLNQPAAGLMAFNLAPDKPAAGFTLSGNSLGNTAINYTGYTGVYLPIYLGNREVRSFDYFTGNTLAIANADFADSMYYSAFLIGANGDYRNIVVKDELAPLTVVPGKAWIRYINAIPDSTTSPVVTIGEAGINEPAPYAGVSSFVQASAGSVTIDVNNGSSISASRV
ncbi:MAG TPA: hypothetical protein VK484_01830, partial [Ferruginibacter sp.]|nr:hypothetical protein [Ferruginibacter sp.]